MVFLTDTRWPVRSNNNWGICHSCYSVYYYVYRTVFYCKGMCAYPEITSGHITVKRLLKYCKQRSRFSKLLSHLDSNHGDDTFSVMPYHFGVFHPIYSNIISWSSSTKMFFFVMACTELKLHFHYCIYNS